MYLEFKKISHSSFNLTWKKHYVGTFKKYALKIIKMQETFFLLLLSLAALYVSFVMIIHFT